MMLLGIDIGGTFTDIVALDPRRGTVRFLKVASTPGRLADGVARGLHAAEAEFGIRIAALERIVHGSTVATNALLEGKLAPTALITTAGFRDVLEIGRQNRPSLYDLEMERPRPLVPRELRFEVPERLDYQGAEIVPLDEPAVKRIAAGLATHGVKSVAVCFLFAYVNPAHERRVLEIIGAASDIPVTLSSDVLPEFREYERTSTTVINAALRPVIGDYLEQLEAEGVQLGFRRKWQIMQSNAGITSSRGAERQPVRIVLSGPAAGVQGARFVGNRAGYNDLITFDMGGTSTDVALVTDGKAARTTDGVIAGYPIKVPMVAVHTIGAGGGSIAWVDSGGGLHVGPRSAGADPGPACYGRGGGEPTATDAQLVLGRLDPRQSLGELPTLDRDAAQRVITDKIARPLGLGLEQAAAGIIAIATANMERAVRVITVERGRDPRDFSLLAFGGAGPLHGPALAAALSIPRVIVPHAAGVLSALGLLCTDLAHDYVRSVVRPVAACDPDEINAVFADLVRMGRDALVRDGVAAARIRCERSLDLRYIGQSYEVNVEIPEQPLDVDQLAHAVARFHTRHRDLYGHSAPDEPVELVNLRVHAVGAVAAIDRGHDRKPAAAHPAHPEIRPVYFPTTGWTDTPVFARAELAPGLALTGPAIIAGRDTTILVPPQMTAQVDQLQNVIIAVGAELPQ